MLKKTMLGMTAVLTAVTMTSLTAFAGTTPSQQDALTHNPVDRAKVYGQLIPLPASTKVIIENGSTKIQTTYGDVMSHQAKYLRILNTKSSPNTSSSTTNSTAITPSYTEVGTNIHLIYNGTYDDYSANGSQNSSQEDFYTEFDNVSTVNNGSIVGNFAQISNTNYENNAMPFFYRVGYNESKWASIPGISYYSSLQRPSSITYSTSTSGYVQLDWGSSSSSTGRIPAGGVGGATIDFKWEGGNMPNYFWRTLNSGQLMFQTGTYQDPPLVWYSSSDGVWLD